MKSISLALVELDKLFIYEPTKIEADKTTFQAPKTIQSTVCRDPVIES